VLNPRAEIHEWEGVAPATAVLRALLGWMLISAVSGCTCDRDVSDRHADLSQLRRDVATHSKANMH